MVDCTSLENWRGCEPTVGSNPTPSAILSARGAPAATPTLVLRAVMWLSDFARDVAQSGSVPAWGAGGRGFESHRSDHF